MGRFYRYYKDLFRRQFVEFKRWLSGVPVQPVIERENPRVSSPSELKAEPKNDGTLEPVEFDFYVRQRHG